MHRPLNDLTIRNLTPAPTYICWDKSLPAFGVRVGKRRKTFIVKKANAYITLGHYGIITLSEARSRAKTHLYTRYLPKPSINATTAADEYLKAISGEKRPATVAAYSIYLKRVPDKLLTELTPTILYEALPESRSAANLCFNIFKAFLSWCVERSYLDSNPLLKRRQPNKIKSRNRLLADEEVRLIWRESYNHSSFGAIARILLLTGQRLNQIASLQRPWLSATDLQFPTHVMKNNVEHVIPLTLAVREDIPAEGFNIKPTDISTYRKKLQDALPQIPHWTPHDFRRYFSTTCSRLGIPIDVTEAILAHTTGSRSEIQRIYDRDNRLPQMRSALQTYQEHVLKIVEQNE